MAFTEKEIEQAKISITNNVVDGMRTLLHQARFHGGIRNLEAVQIFEDFVLEREGRMAMALVQEMSSRRRGSGR